MIGPFFWSAAMRKVETPPETRFGRLSVISEAEATVYASGAKRRLRCQCDCGNQVVVNLGELRRGDTTSCGCIRTEQLTLRSTAHGQAKRGKNRAVNYRLWSNIKSRAVTGTSGCADRYLGRGITLHPEWVDDFEAFNDWLETNLGPRPVGHSLDRKDNDGAYAPGNLRWATPTEQNCNTRRNVKLAFQGETKTLSQWAREFEINPITLWYRLFRSNWAIEKALTSKIRGKAQ